MKIVECSEKYWEFVRMLRMNPKVSDGFVNQSKISEDDQKTYMQDHSEKYRICLIDNVPVGYVGVIDDDIRVCVHPDFWKMGVGKFMIKNCIEIWPDSFAKVKIDNQASLALFKSCGFKEKYIILE